MADSPDDLKTVIVFGDTIPPDYLAYCHRNNLRPRLASTESELASSDAPLYDVISLDDVTQAEMESFRDSLDISRRSIAPLEVLADKRRSKAQPAIAKVSPEWVEFPFHADASDAAAEIERSFGYPCVLKPSNGLYSAGVVRVDTPDEVQNCWVHVLTVARAMKRKRGFGSIVAERFIDGAEFMIDGFRYNGEDFYLVYHQKWPRLSGPTFHEIACITRGICADELTTERAAIEDILDELALDNTPFHAEFRRAPSGEAFLLELAPRLGGGGTSSAEMLRIARGLCSYDILHAINRGCLHKEMIQPRSQKWALEYDFFANRSGRLKNVVQAEAYCHDAGAQTVFRYADDGVYVHEPPMNMTSFLTAFFEVDNYDSAIRKINDITQRSPIETE